MFTHDSYILHILNGAITRHHGSARKHSFVFKGIIIIYLLVLDGIRVLASDIAWFQRNISLNKNPKNMPDSIGSPIHVRSTDYNRKNKPAQSGSA